MGGGVAFASADILTCNDGEAPSGFDYPTSGVSCDDFCVWDSGTSTVTCDASSYGDGALNLSAYFARVTENFDSVADREAVAWVHIGAGSKHCCVIYDPDDEVEKIVLNGSDGADDLGFYHASGVAHWLKGWFNGQTSEAQGRAGDDDILGSIYNSTSKTLLETLSGGADDDTIDGQAGKDTIYGNGGADILDGGSSEDLIYGGAGADTIYGGTHHDDIYGGGGADTIYGDDPTPNISDGQDLIFGDDGDDVIYGGGMVDRINGGDGTDAMYGEGGDDHLCDRNDDDIYDGGDGDDVFLHFSLGTTPDTSSDGGADTLYCDSSIFSFLTCDQGVTAYPGYDSNNPTALCE